MRRVPRATASAAVSLTNIRKSYGGVDAVRGVDLHLQAGSVHGLIGENGAGKSTLMKVLYGLVHPDDGSIVVGGVPCRFRSPADAIRCGIGMVQQHFSLIPDFTVWENVVLGTEPRLGIRLDRRGAAGAVQAVIDRYRFRIDAHARVGNLAVGARQRVEILKVLYRAADIVVLDEPTAALAPQEVHELFDVLRRIRADGKTIVFISHKLPEVVELCDRVTALRAGAVSGHREISGAERVEGHLRIALERDLARLMVGVAPPALRHGRRERGLPVLELRGAGDGLRLGPLDLTVHAGEIVGIAGVEGNGQTELVELILGVRACRVGTITLDGRDVTKTTVARRLRSGIAHVAEDRHNAAIALSLSVTDNACLGFHDAPPLVVRRALGARRLERHARGIVSRCDVRTRSLRAPAAQLSGGNQQKLVVGREMARDPKLMVAAQPTRGLDLAATAFVHQQLEDLADNGSAVLLVSLELIDVLALADQVVVFYDGRPAGHADAASAEVEELGRWMTGSR